MVIKIEYKGQEVDRKDIKITWEEDEEDDKKKIITADIEHFGEYHRSRGYEDGRLDALDGLMCDAIDTCNY